jgi:dienelactone hydrolase
MKKLWFISLALSALSVKAQGPQQLVTVPITPWGHTTKAWLYLPQDYATSTKNYPVVFFYHGVGEAGNNPYILLNQGIPNLIANGMRPDNIINPADGQSYSFIVLSAQDGYWSPSPDWLPHELAWLKQNFRVDTNRVYVTGLSAGGQTSFGTTVTNPEVSRLIAAAVPMSPAGLSSYDPSLVAQNNIETWFFTGNSDGVFTANATTYSTQCNTQYPGSSRLNVYSGGHCCWNNYYNVNWNDPVTGYSVWEWMLLNRREIPLPVTFESFEVKKENNGVKLLWKVSEEINVSHYEIEKSANGRDFSRIGSVMATQQSIYTFMDALVSPNNYYRIKSVDADGKYKYSVVVKLNGRTGNIILKAFPVPATNAITIQHPPGGKLEIVSASGSIVRAVVNKLPAQQTTMDIASLQKGIYYLRFVDTDNNIETLHIIKQ